MNVIQNAFALGNFVHIALSGTEAVGVQHDSSIIDDDDGGAFLTPAQSRVQALLSLPGLRLRANPTNGRIGREV